MLRKRAKKKTVCKMECTGVRGAPECRDSWVYLTALLLYEVTLTLTAALVFPATFTGTGHEVELWSRPLVFIFDPQENTLVSRGSI